MSRPLPQQTRILMSVVLIAMLALVLVFAALA
jgi:hypothetical protein